MLTRPRINYPSIRLLRPLRPPNPTLRPFTSNSQLLLIARHTPRPQLPYLSQPSPIPPTHRLISTETKAYVREVSIQGAKWSLFIWIFVVLAGITMEGIAMEKEERRHATPGEWRFTTRQALRYARGETVVVEQQKYPFIDWAKVGGYLKEVLKRLEDVKREGKSLVLQGDDGLGGGVGEELLIPEVGRAGFDVEAKSYEWKTGYFETLLLAATAAEHLDNMVLDTRRKKVFPREVVIGPSNPDPRPTPVYMASAPKEEDCVKFYEPPETFYMKILTTKGFTTAQRLDAVEGYANWLEIKGLHSSSEEMYRWGIDIAISALPDPTTATTLLDSKTYVLFSSAPSADLTPNLLRATTSLAVHHARTSNLSSALPILLSVLRARRNAPLSPPLPPAASKPEPTTDIGAAISMIRNLISPPRFPPPPPSADEPLIRYSPRPSCEDAELMLYVGEIIFASAPERVGEGVGWTRQGVLVAEANLQTGQIQQRGNTGREDEERKCKECLLTGVQNWEMMLAQLAASSSSPSLLASPTAREGPRNAGFFEWRGWFGRDGGVKGKVLDEVAAGVVGESMSLEEELRQVGKLRERIIREDIEVELAKGRGGGGPWLG